MKNILHRFSLLFIALVCCINLSASEILLTESTNESTPPIWISFYDSYNYLCWYKNDACNTSSGYIHPCVGGGTPPYTYLWSNGATTLNIDNIPAGTYALTVYDAMGDSVTASQVITNGPLEFTFVAPMGLPCYNQCNGTVVYSHHPFNPNNSNGGYFNGTPPYTFTTTHGTLMYDWDAYTNSFSSGKTTLTNICSGVNVTVTATDANGCTGQETFNFVSTPLHNPSISIVPACNSLPNGSVTVGNINTSWGSMGLQVITNTATWTCPTSWGGLSIPWTQNNLMPGDYYLAISHSPTNLNCWIYSGCPQFIPFTIPDLGITCNTIEGNIFVDLNSNCLKDSGEVGIPNTILEFTPGPYYTITNNSGFFTTNLPVGSYTVTQQLPANLIQTCTSAPDTFTISGGTPYYVINFADSSNIPFDIEALLGSGIARPGFDFNYSVNIKNQSYEPSGLLTVTLDYDPMLAFVSANPPPFSTSPGQIVWQLNSIQNFQAAYASVILNVPANPALIGDTVTASVNVVATNPEIDLTNNSKTYNHIITGAYDPNEKQVTPEGNFLPVINNLIDYTILFQNTGNDTAFNVVIIDTLDADLDVTTFVPGASSHPYETELSGQGIVKFIFNNILLPDSISDEPNSHGFISFKIKPKQYLAHNTIISNSSHIVFDFNPPITTNTVDNVVDLSFGVNASETTICEGESVTLTMIPELQNANTTWRWRSGSCTGNLTGYGNSITVSPAVTTTYFVRDSLNTIPTNSCYQKTIIVTPNPSSIQNISICNGQSITVGTNTYTASGTYVDSIQNMIGCDSVITTNLTVLPDNSSTQVISICNGESITVGTSTYSTTGVYVDIFTAANGCDSAVTTDLTVNPPVDVSIFVNANMITANAPGANYQWINCDNNFALIPGETNQSFTVLSTGNYAVIVSENSCSDTSACQFILVTGVMMPDDNQEITIYPNPTTGKIIIESETNEEKIIELNDILGNTIYYNSSTQKKSEIDLSSQSKGVYFIKIIRGENVNVVKIIYF